VEREPEIVLDASVVVKWFSEEEGSDMAVRIRDKHIEGLTTIVSPDLVLYEVVNSLRYNPAFDMDDVTRVIADLIDIGIDLITPSKELMEKAVKHAYECNLSIYDAYYLSLAQVMGLEIITADTEFYEKATKTGIIKLLRHFPI